ncbi:MAG: helix-hairpin-helix domain-containing protein [Candidatus Shapirobacteria bacterium]|nr:helix-hairpin-helix domain-containing protein [Candidatus Shapirobacteria bacterium]
MASQNSPFGGRQYWFQKAVLLDWLLISLGLFLIFLAFGQRQGWLEKEPAVSWVTFESVVPDGGGVVFIDIAGAVNKPGVYQLSAGSRVNDVITACGGVTSWASRDFLEKNLNRARLLEDGEKLFVPYQDQEETGRPEEVLGDKVNINRANRQELMLLSGIGEKYAQEIIDYRQSEGSFSSIEEIKKVKGIGEKTFEEIKDRLEI